MKKTMSLILLLFSSALFISCSNDDDGNSSTNPIENLKFVLNANEQLSLISIRINDTEGLTIHNYDYKNTQNISIEITEGEEIIVYTVDEGMYEYNYQMLNNDDSIQFEGFEQDELNHTLIKPYQLN